MHPRQGAADGFGSKIDPWTLQGRIIWPFCLIFDGSKNRRSQLPAAIIRPGPAKIDVCENLALCKGRVPSISLQVLCGSGCVKSRKFRKKLRKTWFFIRFSLKISERDQKRRQETPKVRKWSKSKPKGAKREPKGSQREPKWSPKWAKGRPKCI